MPIDVSWYIEKHVVIARMSGIVTEEDLLANPARIANYVQEGQPPIYVIIDQSEVEAFPRNFGKLFHSMSKFRSLATQSEGSIIIAKNNASAFVGSIVARILNRPMHTFRTLEDATTYIKRQSPQIDFQSPDRTS